MSEKIKEKTKEKLKEKLKVFGRLLYKKRAVCTGIICIAGIAVFIANSRIETVAQHNARIASEEEARKEALELLLSESETSGEDDILSSDGSMSYAESGKNIDGNDDSLDGIKVQSTEKSDDELNRNDSGGADSSDKNSSSVSGNKSSGTGDSSKDTAGSSDSKGSNSEVTGGASNSTGGAAGSNKESSAGGGSSADPSNGSSSSSSSSSSSGSNGSSSNSSHESEKNSYITVTFSIHCNKVLGNSDLNTSAVIPSDGVMYNGKTVLKEGGSVYDALVAVCSENGISYQGTSTYISAIGGLKEKQCGKLSGWKYKVNGSVPMKTCGACKLNEGDVVEWYYAISPND